MVQRIYFPHILELENNRELTKILEKDADDCFVFAVDYPGMRMAQALLENISPYQFWSVADRYPDLVKSCPCADQTHGNFWTEQRCSLVDWSYVILQILMVNFAFFAKTMLKMSAIFSWIAPALQTRVYR